MEIRDVLAPARDYVVSRGDTVAVVGNSGHLNGAGHGPEIDACDHVVRFNAAPTDGYEADVGRRTSLRVINAITQRGSGCKGTETTTEHLTALMRDARVVCKPAGLDAWSSARRLYSQARWVSRIRHAALRAVQRTARDYGSGDLRAHGLSLGVMVSALLSNLTDGVRLFGFGFHQERTGNVHYWEHVTRDITAHHNYTAERTLIRSMERAGALSVTPTD